MKTAISIPDPVFEAAEGLARQFGVSRSELYTTAIAMCVEAHREEHVTAQLDQLYAIEESALDEVLGQLQAISLLRETIHEVNENHASQP